MLTTAIEQVSPALAAAYLKTMKVNRKINASNIQKFTRDMVTGHWDLTHQGISFNSNGELNDGQNRLIAITQAGVTIPMMVTRGVDNPVNIDTGKPRTVSDAATYQEDWQGLGAKQAAIARILNAESMSDLKYIKMSHAETHNVYSKYRDGIDFSVAHCKGVKGITAAVRSVVAKAYYSQDTQRLKQFCDVLSSGIPINNRDLAALRLRECLAVYSRDPKQLYYRTINALIHFMNGNPLSKLHFREVDPFNLPE